MSRYDYADPGTDTRYCDGISEQPDIEVCPDCHGSGEMERHDATWEPCAECGGRGYYPVAS